MKNDEEVYMQFRNIQQQIAKFVDLYYEHLLKLANCLQVKTIDVFFTIVFRACLLPYLILTTIRMKKNTLIEHKEAVGVCEESGLVNLNYNDLLTTPEANAIVKFVVPLITGK